MSIWLSLWSNSISLLTLSSSNGKDDTGVAPTMSTHIKDGLMNYPHQIQVDTNGELQQGSIISLMNPNGCVCQGLSIAKELESSHVRGNEYIIDNMEEIDDSEVLPPSQSMLSDQAITYPRLTRDDNNISNLFSQLTMSQAIDEEAILRNMISEREAMLREAKEKEAELRAKIGEFTKLEDELKKGRQTIARLTVVAKEGLTSLDNNAGSQESMAELQQVLSQVQNQHQVNDELESKVDNARKSAADAERYFHEAQKKACGQKQSDDGAAKGGEFAE